MKKLLGAVLVLNFMDRITRWEWHGNPLLLTLLCLTGVFLPFAVVYFMTRLLRIEEQVSDASRLSDYIESRGRR